MPPETLTSEISLHILSDLCPLDVFGYRELGELTDETLDPSHEQVALSQ